MGLPLTSQYIPELLDELIQMVASTNTLQGLFDAMMGGETKQLGSWSDRKLKLVDKKVTASVATEEVKKTD